MFEVKPITVVGTTSYVFDVHMIHDKFLAIMMKASTETNEEFIQQLEDSGGLVVVEHVQRGGTPVAVPEMLYLARAAADDEREIKNYREVGDATTVMSMCPVVSLGNILHEVKAGVKLPPQWTEMNWVVNQCKAGLQNFNIRTHAYATRDMRNKSASTI
ncbi:hypothetical protein MYOV003v1_p0194 [Vibrio phage 207E48.1]|nr:hypothetical protein MYOV003v1_p0194 [Vibrio phage 207E48.1]